MSIQNSPSDTIKLIRWFLNEEVKIGDFVMYKCANTGRMVSGLVSDVFDSDDFDVSPPPLYEITSIEPVDRIWLAQHEMSIINRCN